MGFTLFAPILKLKQKEYFLLDIQFVNLYI